MKTLYCDLRRCRLCGCEEGFVEFKDIFEDSQDLGLELKISKLLPIVVMPWDPMPHKMCSTCVYKLNLFNEFYDSVLKTDRFLRTFFPSAPESQTNDPIVQINDYFGMLKNLLKIPPSNFSQTSNSSMSSSEGCKNFKQSSTLGFKNKEQSVNEVKTERTLDSLIVNNITSTDSIFTCRECHRTYMKQSSALSHVCVKLEDYEEPKICKVDSEKSTSPKTRLYSLISGKFICNKCQKAFAKRDDVVDHLKIHFLKENSQKDCQKKVIDRKSWKRNLEISKEEENIQFNTENIKLCQEVEMFDGNSDSFALEKNSKMIDKSQDKTTYSFGVKAKSKNDCKDSEKIPKIKRKDDEAIQIVFDMNDAKRVKNTVSDLFSCVFCDKVFFKKNSLIAHQNMHIQNSEGYCDTSAKYGNKTTFSMYPNDSSSSTQIFKCQICEMTFTKKKLLIDHENFHSVDYGNLR